MKPIHRVERLGNQYVLDVLSAPLEQRERALAEVRAHCYNAALAAGIPRRSAKRWSDKTERITRGLLQLIELRL
jgi:hypothetical protein